METIAKQIRNEFKNLLDEKVISWMQNQDWILDFSINLKKRFNRSKNWKTLVRTDEEWAILWNANCSPSSREGHNWERVNRLYRTTYSDFREEVEREIHKKYLKNNGMWTLIPTHEEDFYIFILKGINWGSVDGFYQDNNLFRDFTILEAYSIGETIFGSIDFSFGGKDTLFKALNIICSIRKKKTPRPSWEMLEWVRKRPWHKELLLRALESKIGIPLEEISKNELAICHYLMNEGQKEESSLFGAYKILKHNI